MRSIIHTGGIYFKNYIVSLGSTTTAPRHYVTLVIYFHQKKVTPFQKAPSDTPILLMYVNIILYLLYCVNRYYAGGRLYVTGPIEQ